MRVDPHAKHARVSHFDRRSATTTTERELARNGKWKACKPVRAQRRSCEFDASVFRSLCCASKLRDPSQSEKRNTVRANGFFILRKDAVQ
jgi:hypothetical protein